MGAMECYLAFKIEVVVFLCNWQKNSNEGLRKYFNTSFVYIEYSNNIIIFYMPAYSL